MPADRLIFEGGPRAGQVVALSERPIVMGRLQSVDVAIADPGVSREHARLSPDGDSYRLEDLGSSNGTFVNDVQVRGLQRLADGDRVRLGPAVVLRLELAPRPAADATMVQPAAQSPLRAEVTAAAEQPAGQTTVMGTQPEPPSPRPARLTIITPDGATTAYPLTAERITLGRLPENDIVVNAAIISRRQLILMRQGAEYRLVVEPAATNPVFHNQEQVREPRVLQNGDELRIGYPDPETAVIMRYEDESVFQADSAANTISQRRPATQESAGTQPLAPRAASSDPLATTIRRSPAQAAQRDVDKTIVGAVVPAAPAVPPQLVVTAAGQDARLYPLNQDRVRIGRSPDNDLVLDNRYVSRFHAEIERRGPDYFIIPAPSTGNPLVLDGQPVMEATRLQHGAKLRVGGYDPAELVTMVFLSPTDEPARSTGQTVQFTESKVMSIGRDQGNDIVLNAPMVSRVHAQLERIGQRYRVRDLGSSNGTFVNGSPLRGEAWVVPGDTIHIGPFRLQVGEQQITQTDESAGGMRVEARGLNKRVRKDLNLLQDISLVFQPREFIVVVGQSGGGKSTLVDAISGYRPATHGQVLVNETIDVYKNFDAIRNSIGYVPQRDIIHMELTVFQALDYAAQLRMSADTTREERHTRIDSVLEELDLTHRRDTQISELSGGQQKRVSIGVELLNKPGLFFLDEPTSGLDPGTETELMQLMRRLADSGRTVVLITHATKNVMLADRVVFLARGGYLAWFGPPEEALRYFDQYRSERERRTKPIEFDDIYGLLDRPELGSAPDWAERFKQHPAHGQYIVKPLGAETPPTPHASPAPKGRATRRPVSGIRQFFILSSRNIKILTRDKPTLALMLLAAPLMASLDFTLAFGVGRNPFGFLGGDFNDILITLIVLTNNAILVGALAMARELVKERDIYKRERMVNLRLSSYILSKLWFVLLLAAYNAICFTVLRYVAFQMPGGPADFVFFLITTFLMVVAGMMIGLFTSALAPNANAAPLIMVLFILPQIVLSGALVPLPKAISAAASSHWAFQAAMAMSGAGSDVAGDVCWTDKTSEEREAMTRAEKDSQCACMGVNTLREESCNFPGVGDYYDAAVDAADPVKPNDPGDAPPAPDFPEAPKTPENLADPTALKEFFDALQVYNDDVEQLRSEYQEEVDAYQKQVDAYKVDIETYQDKLTELETDRASAIGSAEALIERFQTNYGWTFVDKSDRSGYIRTLAQTWLAQLAIISVLLVGTVLAQKRFDIR